MTDLDNPQFHFEYEGPTAATDHNGYVKGNIFYLANNAAGLRMVDISDIENSVMEEVAFFDSYPTDNDAGYTGSWNAYPYFESGIVVISDRVAGMLLVRPNPVLSVPENELATFKVFPNPAGDIFTITGGVINSIVISDMTGKQVYARRSIDTTTEEVVIETLASGMYTVRINETTALKLIKR